MRMIKNLKDLELNEQLHKQLVCMYNNISQVDPNVFNFDALCKFIQNLQSNHNIYVFIHEGKIIGAITLLIESKIIHSGGKVGHVEDFVVLESYRRQGVGHQLITHVQNEAMLQHCYKVILDCTSQMVPYYTKKGLMRKGICMAKYY